jgi:hypothetical protein
MDRGGRQWGDAVGLNGREPEGTRLERGAVLTFQHEEGSLEQAVEKLKGRGVEFPAEISDHDWGRVATFNGPNVYILPVPRGWGRKRCPILAVAFCA